VAQVTGSTLGMVRLEGGTFLMGTDSERAWAADGEGPVREVTLRPFWIDECAVTNANFAEFIAATGFVTEAERFGWSYVFHKFVKGENRARARGVEKNATWWVAVDGAYWKCPEGPGSNVRKRAEHPVVHVSWNDAVAYCAWAGKRLPTEAEWEYASRGGLEQKFFPWGDELLPRNKHGRPEHRCNIWQGKFPDLDTGADGHIGTAPARSFPPNAFGLYNTSGNTWEWCADWFSSTHPGPFDNPAGPADGEARVMKGGSYLCHISYCDRYRVAARTKNTPDAASGHLGFRCARDV